MRDTEKKLKKSNVKIYVIFAVIVLGSLIGGFFAGRQVGANKETLESIDWDSMWRLISVTLPIVYTVAMAALFIVTFVMYGRIKSAVKAWDGDEEDVIDGIERKITLASFLPCMAAFTGFLVFPICIYAAERTGGAAKFTWYAILSELIFMVTFVLYCVAEKLLVDEEKRLNPEKKGNIFDVNFRRDWEQSSDEAELIMAARSSKKGFMAGIKACFVLWVITFVCMFAFDTGVLPVASVSIVLVVMYVAYGAALVKLQR